MMTSDKQEWDDEALTAQIIGLCNAVKQWARNLDIWFDCNFSSYIEHVNGEPPSPAIVCLLLHEGQFLNHTEIYENTGNELIDIIRPLGFTFEVRDSTTIQFLAEDENLNFSFERYFQWRWVCKLIQPDFDDIYEEVFNHFAKRPEDLHRLGWRQFEILLSRVFQSQGFKVELGPGRGDEGVDIKLLQTDPIGDILTLVQARKYAPQRKIRLEAVAALDAVTSASAANRGLFVTTSEYLPGVRRFARRTPNRVSLATSNDIQRWCEQATTGIIKNKASLVERSAVIRILQDSRNCNGGRIVHATYGWNMTINDFAIVVKETRHAALLMRLPAKTVCDDGYGQSGTEIPLINEQAVDMHVPENVFRAQRIQKNGRVSYWTGERLFSSWNQQPRIFDYRD